jgi:molybdopterin molybdotransferase
VRAGERVLSRGAPIHAPEIAALASVGRTRVRVYRAPVVQVLSSGDEVVEPDVTPAPHQVRNSNARCLLAQLRELRIEGRYLGIAPDTREGLKEAVRAGLNGDVLLVTGGVSMGKYDLVGEVLAEAGMRQVFHKVAVRPGKPMLVGRRGDCLVVGLPGNPVSTFTGFAVFVVPALRKMMGYARCDNLQVTAVLAERLKRKPGRTTYHLARVAQAGDGFTALPVRAMGSGDVVSMSRANAFVITPPGAHALDPGTRVDAILWPHFNLR